MSCWNQQEFNLWRNNIDNTILLENAKKEAVDCLGILDLHKLIPKYKDGSIYKSIQGFLYWLDEDEKKMVAEFEQENNAVVYHIIHQKTNIGELYNLLFVNLDDSEWDIEREDLKNEQALAYVVNKTYPESSEFGMIGMQRIDGGLKRIW